MADLLAIQTFHPVLLGTAVVWMIGSSLIAVTLRPGALPDLDAVADCRWRGGPALRCRKAGVCPPLPSTAGALPEGEAEKHHDEKDPQKQLEAGPAPVELLFHYCQYLRIGIKTSSDASVNIPTGKACVRSNAPL